MRLAKWTLATAILARLLCAQGDTGSISGNVTNSITGAPIEGVRVWANCLSEACRSPDPEPQATTDAAGAFRIDGIRTGGYQVNPQKTGFLQVRPPGMGVISVSGDTRVDVQMTPHAKLGGRVSDPEGRPVAGITVQLGGRSILTDQDGAFVFDKVPPGSQILAAKAPPQPDGKDGERLVTTYFPSAIYPDQAQRISVEGVDLSGYEIKLRTAPARTVRGVVIGATGKPVPRANVVIAKPSTPGPLVVTDESGCLRRQISSLGATPWDRLDAAEDGAFEFAAVLEGDWKLQVYDFSSRNSGATEVRVGRNNVENVEIRLTPPFEIEASPDWGDVPPTAVPTAVSGILACLVPIDGQTAPSGENDGESKQWWKAFAGRYLIGPAGRAAPGYYLAAAMLNSRDVLGQAVDLSGPAEFKMVYRKDGGSVHGTVENGAGATVILMADPSASARFGRRARCDADGNFSIPDVAPGSYTVAAFQNLDPLDADTPEVQSRIDSRGERVKVEADAAATVSLRVN